MRKTKIVCTIGPACSTPEIMEKMLKEGMNVARFNMSHGDHEEHLGRINMVKKVRDELDMPVALLLDTKGPEIRLKDFKDGSVILESGNEFTLTSDDVLGDNKIASVTYENLPYEVETGCKILIDDGKVELLVLETNGSNIKCQVVNGGKIGNHKGVNVPSVHLNMPYLSDVDKADLLFGIKQDVDYIAASFIRNKEDVLNIRDFLDYNGGNKIRIIAKIENQEGIDNFEEILENVSGIMVARGDMGVEVDFEKLPGIQKRFINKCCLAGKIVITATQMLESMINNPSPTRAEISDVANAVFDGTSAIMLSGETANGKYPVETVKVMSRIAARAEKDAFALDNYDRFTPSTLAGDATLAISHATCTTARDLKAKAIITVSQSGITARRISRFRPQELIVAATPSKKTYHQLALSWGINPVLSLMQSSTDDLLKHAIICAKSKKFVKEGDTVVITAGVPIGVPGNTNLLRVATVDSDSL